MKRKKGVLISFEGGEGTGKTSQAGLLYEFLRKKKLQVLLLEEPGGARICVKIRSILLDKKLHGKIFKETELMLFLASRAQLINEVIIPALKKGCIVICDRYTDSTIAYQGYGRGIPIKFINTMNEFVSQKVRPHLTVLLDIDEKIGLIRAAKSKGGKDRIELENRKFMKNVRHGYLSLAKKEPGRFCVINGRYSIDKIQTIIQKRVLKILCQRYPSGIALG